MPLASPWNSPFLVNRRFLSAAWPQNETAELVQKALANFRGSDRRFPTAVRNRRSDLGDLIPSVSNGGHNRRSRNRRMKPPKFPCSLGNPFCGYVLRPGRRMKPPIGDFKGQTCLFTCPVLEVYKYLTFSCSEKVLECLRTLHFQERKSFQELLFNHSNQNTFASYFIFDLLCLHRIDPCMFLNHHISYGMFFTNFILF
jgi:hypothetical protein